MRFFGNTGDIDGDSEGGSSSLGLSEAPPWAECFAGTILLTAPNRTEREVKVSPLLVGFGGLVPCVQSELENQHRDPGLSKFKVCA